MLCKNESVIAVVGILLLAMSFCVTLLDPDASTGVPMALVWLCTLTIILVGFFSGLNLNVNQKIISIIGWIIRVVWATNQSLGNGLPGDPFFEMGYSVYYGYDTCIHIDYPILTNYPGILAKWFHITGPNRFIASYMNAFLAMLAAFLVIKCVDMLEVSRSMRTIITAIMLLNPFIVVFDADVYREAIYLVLSALSLYFFVRWVLSKRELLNIILALMLTIPIVYLHTGYIMITIAYFCAALIDFKSMRMNRWIYKVLAMVFFLMAGYILIQMMGGELSNKNYLSKLFHTSIQKNVDEQLNIFNQLTDSGSMYLRWMTSVNSVPQFAVFTVIRVFEFLFSPLPFENVRLVDFVGFIMDSMIYLTAFCFLLKTKLRRYHYECRLILLCAVSTIILVALLYSWGTMSAGTAIRHRQCLLPMVCCMLGILSKYKHESLYDRHVSGDIQSQVE